MAKEHPPDQTAENEDIDDVLSTLDAVAARAAAGSAVGIMVIVRDRSGTDFCASAGWYNRNPESSLFPALQGLVQMCGSAERPQSLLERGVAFPQTLH